MIPSRETLAKAIDVTLRNRGAFRGYMAEPGTAERLARSVKTPFNPHSDLQWVDEMVDVIEAFEEEQRRAS